MTILRRILVFFWRKVRTGLRSNPLWVDESKAVAKNLHNFFRIFRQRTTSHFILTWLKKIMMKKGCYLGLFNQISSNPRYQSPDNWYYSNYYSTVLPQFSKYKLSKMHILSPRWLVPGLRYQWNGVENLRHFAKILSKFSRDCDNFQAPFYTRTSLN